MSGNRGYIIAAVIFMVIAVGGFVALSGVYSSSINKSAEREGGSASRPPIATTNPQGTTGSNVPPANNR
jgi:hypothetical protein